MHITPRETISENNAVTTRQNPSENPSNLLQNAYPKNKTGQKAKLISIWTKYGIGFHAFFFSSRNDPRAPKTKNTITEKII